MPEFKRNRMMAGPRLNALVDERVFYCGYTGKDYSDKIEDAWEIVRRYANVPFSLVRFFRDGWFANFNMPYDATLLAETEELAICYAGLKREYVEYYITEPDCAQKAHEYMVGLFGFEVETGTSNLDLWEELRQSRLTKQRRTSVSGLLRRRNG